MPQVDAAPMPAVRGKASPRTSIFVAVWPTAIIGVGLIVTLLWIGLLGWLATQALKALF